MPDFSYETNIVKQPRELLSLMTDEARVPLVAGIDEAGCGPWAGPVVAGAVIFKSHDALAPSLHGLLDDSKALSAKKRSQAFSLLTAQDIDTRTIDLETTSITQQTYCGKPWSQDLWAKVDQPWSWGIGLATVAEIDTMNIRQATLLAMKRATEALPLKPTYALVDGISMPDINIHAQTIKKGDSLSFSIAAASILAKVYRDHYMQQIAKKYPHYGWEKNAGYGTKYHQDAIDAYGVTPHHRTSFRPIAERIALVPQTQARGGL